MKHTLFLIASAREHGNSEILALEAAKQLPAEAQTWLRLQDLPLEPFEDIRHSVGVYPQPTGNAKILFDATLAASDIVMVSPVYWYNVPTTLKRYLDEMSAWMRVPEANFLERMSGKTMWVVSSLSGDPINAEPMLNTLRLSAQYLKMHFAGHVIGNGSKPGDVNKDIVALESARNLFVGGV
jgi:NAD(P)H-dependent FMN reductase